MAARQVSPRTVFPRISARCSAKALVNNYRAIQELVPGQGMLPMIKANAYGHGAAWAAKQLDGLSALYGFGVATLEEAREVREALGSRGKRTRIVVFSGIAPWSEEKGQFCEKFNLTPVLATERDWHLFYRGKWHEKIAYELKFNTGMNRLGLPVGFAASIARALRDQPGFCHPSGVFSHLAVADDPHWRLSRSQRENFLALRKEFSTVCPATQFHLAGSAGIWNEKLWGLQGMTDLVRPGISLYGVPPWDQAPARGLAPVMTLQAEVIHTHRLKRGESTGYGGGFTVASQEAVHVAVIAGGYADGIKRSLSSKGFVWIGGGPSRFLGNVSMDLATVQCSEKTKVGEWVEIIGVHVDIWAQAKAAGTIPYELLTSVSNRVERIYD